MNEAFVVSREKRDELIAEHASSAEVLKPFLRGRDIKRWGVEFQDRYLVRIESSENAEHPWSNKSDRAAEKVFAATYPAVYEFMKPLRQDLIDRSDQGKYFWELPSCAYWEEFERPKIIYPDIYEHQSFAWDEKGYCGANTCYFIPTDEMWLSGILNSLAVEWFYAQISNKVRGGYMRAFTDYMRTIPVPTASSAQKQGVTRLAEYLTLLRGSASGSGESPYLERLLNGLVYEIFFGPELHAQKLTIFKYLEAANPPKLKSIPKAQRESALREFHAKISDINHPIYSCLFELNGVEVVRIIEGKDQEQ